MSQDHPEEPDIDAAQRMCGQMAILMTTGSEEDARVLLGDNGPWEMVGASVFAAGVGLRRLRLKTGFPMTDVTSRVAAYVHDAAGTDPWDIGPEPYADAASIVPGLGASFDPPGTFALPGDLADGRRGGLASSVLLMGVIRSLAAVHGISPQEAAQQLSLELGRTRAKN